MQGTRPTRKQAELISKWGLLPRNWLVLKNEPHLLTIKNKYSDKERKIPEGVKVGNKRRAAVE